MLQISRNWQWDSGQNVRQHFWNIQHTTLLTGSSENVEIDIRIDGPISRYYRVNLNLLKPDQSYSIHLDRITLARFTLSRLAEACIGYILGRVFVSDVIILTVTMGPWFHAVTTLQYPWTDQGRQIDHKKASGSSLSTRSFFIKLYFLQKLVAHWAAV